MKSKSKNYKKKCPTCGIELNYKNNQLLNRSLRNNSKCKPCSKRGVNHPMYGKPKTLHPMYGKYGENNPNYGRKNTSEAIQKMREVKIGKCHTVETKQKISKIKKIQNKGKNNPMYGKTHPMKGKTQSEEFCKKQRLRRIAEINNSNGQTMPNYNKSSILILEQKARELGITDLQHAESGGEFHIKQLGYFVDGYSKDKNIVIEYYEKHHNKQKERDTRRQKEITNLLKCEFIIINE